jgi:endonuclease YncB( thermonuclease family)
MLGRRLAAIESLCRLLSKSRAWKQSQRRSSDADRRHEARRGHAVLTSTPTPRKASISVSDVRHRVFVRAAAALFVLALLVHAVTAAEITGRVVGIADGDTLTILDADHRQTKVRLAEIDAPESHQPYGTRAKQVLSELVFGRDVRVVVVDIDRYGRTVGRIYANTLDVSAAMVRQGAAWVFVRYNHDPSLSALEQEARQARRGLWALPEAERVPPWEWRADARAARQRGRMAVGG